MRPSLLAVVTWVLAVGCSRPVSSQALGLEYEPPSGVTLSTEEVGPPAVARFAGGLELRSVPGTPPALEATPEAVLGAAGVSMPGKRVNSAQGTLAAGPVGRYEFKQADTWTLIYFLPRPDRFLLITFSAPSQDYGQRSARVERSLSTLRLLR